MIAEGQVVLFRFPQTNQDEGKLRLALLLRRLSGGHNDWLICMISSQIHQAIPDFDETISELDSDFQQSGLKLSSAIRISRLAIIDERILLGRLGEIDPRRLYRIRRKLAAWIEDSS
jgi:mRNA interferase MazF